jgi:periplasmic protein TonB
MTLAAAPRFDAPLEDPIPAELETEDGAHSLLHLPAPPPHHSARIGAVVLYLALIAAILTVGFRANEAPVEELQVVELAPLPSEEESQPEDIPPPPETMQLDELPPPPALQPIAPVEQKPIEKPKPLKKVEKPVEHKPAHEARPSSDKSTRHEHAEHSGATAQGAATEAKPGATMSAAANALHACLQRAAASIDAPRSGRVSYHASISASGSVTSFSISSSGNAALDAIANRIGARCTSVPAPGRPGSLSGGISFSGP